jgi:hypothetical protein
LFVGTRKLVRTSKREKGRERVIEKERKEKKQRVPYLVGKRKLDEKSCRCGTYCANLVAHQ